jgi:hypothetical protein
MDGQQLYKEPEKIQGEKINKGLQLIGSQLDSLLLGTAAYVKEKATNDFGIKEFGVRGYSLAGSLDCRKGMYGGIQCDNYDFTLYVLNSLKDKDEIECHSNSTFSPNKLRCTHYSSRSSFELSDLPQITNFLDGMKYLVLIALGVSKPEAFTDMGDQQRMRITVTASRHGKEEPNINIHYQYY